MKIKKPLINLFYLTNVKYGGWMTYTVHLYKALQAAGAKVRIYRVTNTTQPKPRDFGYGLSYQNISRKDIEQLPGVHIITATGKNFHEVCYDLFDLGAWITIHDPNEIKNEEFKEEVISHGQVFVIRLNNRIHLPEAEFIPHPFHRADIPKVKRSKHAIAISRIDFDKRTHWILEANRQLTEDRQITVMGEETRQYTYRQLCPKFPEFKQNSDREEDEKSRFPRVFGLAQAMCAEHKFMVDLSEIKNDGGGTQYTFLEAIDAGAVCVLNDAWIKKDGVMQPGENCLSVDGPTGLVNLMNSNIKLTQIRKNAEMLLEDHNPKKIGKAYLERIL